MPKEDLELLLEIYNVGFEFYKRILVADRKKQIISYNFHLRNQEGRLILINQKLPPLFSAQNGKIWTVICIVSISPNQNSRNSIIEKKELLKCFQFNLEDKNWYSIDRVQLTNGGKEILQFFASGFTIIEISENIFVSSGAV